VSVGVINGKVAAGVGPGVAVVEVGKTGVVATKGVVVGSGRPSPGTGLAGDSAGAGIGVPVSPSVPGSAVDPPSPSVAAGSEPSGVIMDDGSGTDEGSDAEGMTGSPIGESSVEPGRVGV